MPRLTGQVLDFYKRRLRTPPKVRYVFAFTMNSRHGQLNYHLVFASQHPRGLEKMKEAMRQVDRSGGLLVLRRRTGPGAAADQFRRS